MGKEKYLRKIEALFDKSPVVDASSIARIIDKKQYPKQLIRNLVKSGKINILAKGCYTRYEDASLAVFCFSPAYLGLQDALSFHNIWEQETIPIIITSRKVRQGIRKVMGMNLLIRRIDKKYVFGFELYKQKELYLPYSDVEKTFIDLVYFNEKISEEVLAEIRKKTDKKRLDTYLKRYPKRFKNKVLSLFS